MDAGWLLGVSRGSGHGGQLGTGTISFAPYPVPFADLHPAASLSAGFFHTCVALQNGTTWCSGRNASGQLGDGTFAGSTLPVLVPDR